VRWLRNANPIRTFTSNFMEIDGASAAKRKRMGDASFFKTPVLNCADA
jgi:hypothetical protein